MDPQALARLALLSAILALGANTAPAAVSTPGAQGPAETYIVQAGDTLFAVALKFNTTIAAIQEANGISDPTALAVGQRLIIPGAVAQNVATPVPTARGPTDAAPTKTAAGSPTETAAGSEETETYIVKSGDTLAAIAAQFGVSLEELERVNGIDNPNLLNVGQRLIIPKATNTAVALPEGVSIVPEVVRQGQTITLRVKADNVSEVLGKFDQQTLRFNKIGDEWVAMIGISRCANYIGAYKVALTKRDILGTPTPVEFEVRVNAGSFTTNDITLTPGMSALLDPAVQNAENALVAQTVTQYNPGQSWQGGFEMPLQVPSPRVSALFGERRSYNGGAVGLCGHEGQDFAVPGGTPVYAPAAGVVVVAQTLKVRGNVVIIDHGRGVYSGFFHMSELVAQEGQRVQAGEEIGKVGTTGFSTGNHLHWSMWVNGIYVDPIQWTTEQIP